MHRGKLWAIQGLYLNRFLRLSNHGIRYDEGAISEVGGAVN